MQVPRRRHRPQGQRARAFKTPLGIAPRKAQHRQRGPHALIIEPSRGEQPPDDVDAVRADPPRPLLAAFPVPPPPYGLPRQVGLVRASAGCVRATADSTSPLEGSPRRRGTRRIALMFPCACSTLTDSCATTSTCTTKPMRGHATSCR